MALHNGDSGEGEKQNGFRGPGIPPNQQTAAEKQGKADEYGSCERRTKASLGDEPVDAGEPECQGKRNGPD